MSNEMFDPFRWGEIRMPKSEIRKKAETRIRAGGFRQESTQPGSFGFTNQSGALMTILDCGGKRSATSLWSARRGTKFPRSWCAQKRRRRCALPAQSTTQLIGGNG